MRPTDSHHPALTLETLQDLRRYFEEWRPEIDRIVVGCPEFESDRVRKWSRGRMLFVGHEVIAALTRAASTPLERVDPVAFVSFGGIALEAWGSRADHSQVAAEAKRDLDG